MWTGRRRRRLLTLLLAATLGAAGVIAEPARHAASKQPDNSDSSAHRVSGVRFWSLGDTTRIAVEIDAGEFQYKYDRLQNPDRLFFDIEGVKPPVDFKRMQTIEVGDALVKQIRVAETQPGVTRVVVDLNGDLDFSASQLTNPSRLMIEVRVAQKNSPSITPSATAAAKLSDLPTKPAAPDMSTPLGPADTIPVSASSRGKVKSPPATPAVAAEPIARGTAAADGSAAKVADLTTALPAKTRDDPSMTRVLGLKLGRVVIDPGHGGHDTGTRGPNGYLEKDLVLDVARRLGALIESRLGSEVVFTRSDDTFIPLEDRTRIANEHKADLFLSIHANSSPTGRTSGVETYYLNFTTDKAALDVAARENAASQHSIYDLRDLVDKIARKDKIDESRAFAQKVQASLASFWRRSNSRSRDRGVRQAPFVVLIGASMPSVLAEIGFLSNVRDERLMRKSHYRQQIAEALFKGLSAYAATLSHFQVAQGKVAQ
jgi:N-acetylmuramoyl-L-alanine amidase